MVEAGISVGCRTQCSHFLHFAFCAPSILVFTNDLMMKGRVDKSASEHALRKKKKGAFSKNAIDVQYMTGIKHVPNVHKNDHASSDK